MGWRGRSGGQRGLWPGRGAFSHLPPWQRPGWLYGRGVCWLWFSPYMQTTTPTVPETPIMPTLTKEQETQMLEQQMNFLQVQLDTIKKRLEELKTGD